MAGPEVPGQLAPKRAPLASGGTVHPLAGTGSSRLSTGVTGLFDEMQFATPYNADPELEPCPHF